MYRWMRRAMALPVLWAVVLSIGLLAVPAADAAVHSAASGQAVRFASEATAYQNKVLERALSRVPGGTRISPSEVRWPDGNIIGVGASPKQSLLNDCLEGVPNSLPQDAFCGFAGTGYTVAYLFSASASGSGYWVEWGALGLGMHSWWNNTAYRVWREQFVNSGNELCIDPAGGTGNGNDYYNPDYNGPDVNDYWDWMSVNSSDCA
jgi:hypothetical protein